MKIYITIFFATLTSCFNPKVNETDREICLKNSDTKETIPIDLSVVFKINTALNERRVFLKGYFSYYFENVALYPTIKSNKEDAIWLNFKKEIISKKLLQTFRDKKVSVTGILNLSNNGHLNLFASSLDSIDCIKLE